MKKLIAVIMILALLAPAAVLADRDPIVGSWYFLYDKALYPEFASTFGDADVSMSVYWFTESGAIMSTDLAASGTSGESSFLTAGRWSRADNGYNYSIVAIGEGTILLEDDSILLSLPNMENYYMVMRRMVPFNPYRDYIRK